ncbi:MAG: cytochrome P450 [Methylomonas sp.]
MLQNRTIPEARGDFLLGNIRQVKANPFQAFCDWQREYGDLVGFRIATQKFYLFSHPKLVEQALIKQSDVFVKMYNPEKPKGLGLVLGQGLVTSKGDLWQRQRRLIQPVFQRSNLASLLPQIAMAGKHLLSRWRLRGDGAEVNLCDEMMRMTLEVITQTMFSTSVLDKIDQIGPALETALRHAAKNAFNPVAVPLWMPTQANQAFTRSMALLDEVIYGIIEQRRAKPSNQPDLLDMLLEARDQGSGKKMTDQQIRDEVITIFAAGHETTSNLLSWTLYLLAKNPDVLCKLREELEAMPKDKIPKSSDLQGLSYIRAVLNESMRIRPPVGIMIRKLSQDTKVDGYAINAGSLAIFSIYNIHHHPEFWPEPERFDPDRFLTNENRRFSYMPFGTGERVCIGNHFAMLESQLLLSMIVQCYDIELLSEDDAVIDMAVSLRPKGGLPVRIRRRA